MCLSKHKEFQYGICINSIECSEKKNASKMYKIYKGSLVEISEHNNKILLSLVNFKLKCYAQSDTNFHRLDERLFRYLNAINNLEARLKFYEDATRREFVLQLTKNSRVNVAFPNGQYTKAKFQEEHENENNEIFITVELLGETPEFFKNNISRGRYFGKENKNKNPIISFPADMIRKCDFRDVNKMVAENLKIPKSKWRCIECLEENLAGNNRCQQCRTASPNADPNVSGNNLNTKQVQRNSQVNKRSHPNFQNSTSRFSTKTSDYVVSNYQSNTDFDRSNHEHKFLHTAETKTSYLQSHGPYPKIGTPVRGEVNKMFHPNVQNGRSRISTKTSDYVVAYDEPNTDFDPSNEDHEILHDTAETKTSYLQSDGPYQKIGTPDHGDEEAYKQNSISQNPTRYVLLQNELCRQNLDVLNNEDKNYFGSMAVEHNAKSENENCKNYEVLNVHSNERRGETVSTMRNCSVCFSSNECVNNTCKHCGDSMAFRPNAKSEVPGVDYNEHAVKTTASNAYSDEKPSQTLGTTWNCSVCQSSNEYFNNICRYCGEKNAEIPYQYNSETSMDPNLIVANSVTETVDSNPYESTEHHGSNNYVPNAGGDLIQFSESLVRQSSSDTSCIICETSLYATQGFFLSLCNHTICEICIKTHMTYEKLVSTNNVPCCERSIELNEIKNFLPEDEYKQFRTYLIDLIESNSFIQRCYNKSCSGYHLWEIYNEDKVEFRCNKCNLNNCLKCHVIHDGLTCAQYRKLTDGGNSVDRETVEMFLNWIRDGIAMPCPKCEMLIEKDEGCDWVQCSFCTTEICWATRGYRWGPAGNGDTSGGCKCTKDKKCIDTCNYCH